MVVANCALAPMPTYTPVSRLELTQDSYYSHYNFAEVFASLKRAPESLRDRLAEIPGVGRVQTRIVHNVNLSVPGFEEPASGKLISLPESGPPLLNQLYFRLGLTSLTCPLQTSPCSES